MDRRADPQRGRQHRRRPGRPRWLTSTIWTASGRKDRHRAEVPHTHAFVATETVEPGCLDGYTLETCSCGATRKRILPGNGGHQYTVTEVVPLPPARKRLYLKDLYGVRRNDKDKLYQCIWT